VADSPNTKPFNVRLPLWAIRYIDERAAEQGVTKTHVVLEALSSLRAQELQALMRQGYEEMREADRQMAHDTRSISLGGLPE
jgi:hypothetical protein